ncbi:MAG TPA: FAD-dependent oxidoreductase [Burkholderiales bacterium]|nr:FAD-dependent oxidoreductase [Burkholderiales bacterium]
MKTESPKIAVIGGGIGGMISALQMAEAGGEVTLFEATERLGGHMTTHSNGWDAGAQVIYSRETRLRAWAKELNVPLVPLDEGAVMEPAEILDLSYRIEGKTYSAKDFSRAFAPLAPALADLQANLRDADGNFTSIARGLDDMSVDEFLDKEHLRNHLSDDALDQLFAKDNVWVITAIKQVYATEFGQTSDLSALALADSICVTPNVAGFYSLGDSDKMYQFANDASSLINALENKLTEAGVTIRRNTLVTKLEEAGTGMTVQFSSRDGESSSLASENYNSVISALPPQALVDVAGVGPLLLAEQWEALQGTKTVSLVKICCPTKNVDIDAEVCIQTSEGSGVHVWQNGEGKGGEKGSLTFYCEGVSPGTDIAGEFIEKLKYEYAAAINKAVDDIFDETGPIIKDWREHLSQSIKGNGCFFIPTKKHYINLGGLHNQKHRAFSLVGGAPVEYPRANGKGVTWNTGCMDGIVVSAEREAARQIAVLQAHGHRLHPKKAQQAPESVLDLSGRQLSAEDVPDLTQRKELKAIILENNHIQAEGIAMVLSKMPEGCAVYLKGNPLETTSLSEKAVQANREAKQQGKANWTMRPYKRELEKITPRSKKNSRTGDDGPSQSSKRRKL